MQSALKNSQQKNIAAYPREELIHVLSSTVTITPQSGLAQTFNKGDFFVMPRGCSAQWESRGTAWLRLLKVYQKS